MSFCETKDTLYRPPSFCGDLKKCITETRFVLPDQDTPRPMTSSALFSTDELRVQDFFIALAVCNTTVVSVNKNNPIPLEMPSNRKKSTRDKKGFLGRRSGDDSTSNKGRLFGRLSTIFSSSTSFLASPKQESEVESSTSPGTAIRTTGTVLSIRN
ncbi:hypothetical protein Ciccas_002203 [Cichlidogyrus casuarinus]|uniref:Uncharacterized protein n=1 Tax=Cichlidogyrus casuarinus TaxID=1844966 RepID=A0ABD2QHY3_9PLAT